jgi:hypothetical protein
LGGACEPGGSPPLRCPAHARGSLGGSGRRLALAPWRLGARECPSPSPSFPRCPPRRGSANLLSRPRPQAPWTPHPTRRTDSLRGPRFSERPSQSGLQAGRWELAPALRSLLGSPPQCRAPVAPRRAAPHRTDPLRIKALISATSQLVLMACEVESVACKSP